MPNPERQVGQLVWSRNTALGVVWSCHGKDTGTVDRDCQILPRKERSPSPTRTSDIWLQVRYSSSLQPGVVGETTKERSELKDKVREESVRDDSIFRRRDPR